MRTLIAGLLLLLTSIAPAMAQQPAAADAPAAADPWFSTFSIIAFDPATKELGVGVQSRAFGAGAAVPFAIPGVGAVATQASANRSYGPKAIAMLQQGLSPAEIVKRITDEDEGRDSRQVAVIDAKGRSAVYTGKRVIDRNSDPKDPVHLGGYAGHVTGVNFSVQGNTLASEAVVKAMAAAYESGKGSMAERLMDALDAGQSKGGDTRGMQSAGLLVVKPLESGSTSTVERIVDLRVDDAPNPFVELRRLLDVTQGRAKSIGTSNAPGAAAAAQARPQMTPEQQAALAAKREAEMNAPRPIPAMDSVWTEELTWMEVRDAIKAGKTTALILTGGVESNGPHLATGKHNYVLKATGEAIARKLGNALIAPIVTLEPGRPDGRVAPGSVFLSAETYKAVLTDMATSLKSMGFTSVVFLGDSGGNQSAMKEVAEALNTKFTSTPARFYFIPEYYDYPSARRFVQANGITETMDPQASQGSDGIHEEYAIDALMMLTDPKTIRLQQRIEAKKATINGASLIPAAKTIAFGKRILELRTNQTVDAINKAMAGAKTSQ
jgi:uncharacterized Ntn-hydrolase superfamily protein/creatinine amidohydrolase/Fe(II)-dependent formamide hydrolase-like protein